MGRHRVLEFGFGACAVYKGVLKDEFSEVCLVDRNSIACHCAKKYERKEPGSRIAWVKHADMCDYADELVNER